MWRSGNRRCHVRMPDLEMCCSFLTTWQGVRLVTPALATRRHAPLFLIFIYLLWPIFYVWLNKSQLTRADVTYVTSSLETSDCLGPCPAIDSPLHHVNIFYKLSTAFVCTHILPIEPTYNSCLLTFIISLLYHNVMSLLIDLYRLNDFIFWWVD